MSVEEYEQTVDGDSSDSCQYPSDDETSVYERRVLKLKRRRERAFFSEFKENEVARASDLVIKSSPPPSPIKRRSPKKRHSTPLVVLQPRKSQRLSTKTVDYEGLDHDWKEPPMYRRKSFGGRRHRTPRIGNGPRDVEFNPDALSGTVNYGCKKVYSQSGTTCHQCRQKTNDLKSRCYSPYCRGSRGMFCGYCLLQRYGEDVAVVLRDPNWKCPPCRKICNCSICRRIHGKPPTGQLFPSVSHKGYNNVLEYLTKIGDDKLEDCGEADDESEEGGDIEDVSPPVKKMKTSDEDNSKKNKVLVVKLERLDLSFDEDGNLVTEFKGF